MKKDAKQYASKKAIDWLIANHYIRPRQVKTVDEGPTKTIDKGPIKIVDEEMLRIEQLARDEIGDFNWIGQLLGMFVRPYNRLSYLVTKLRVSERTPSNRRA